MGNKLKEITAFLNSIEGWADESAVESEPMPGLHTITIKKGKFTYLDQYGGGEPFQGLETVWIDNHLEWMMSYRGDYNGKAPYADFGGFLKASLRAAPKSMPVRGPKNFVNQKFPGWKYDNEWKGDISEFKGKEKITFKDSKVYYAEYYGGSIDLRKDT